MTVGFLLTSLIVVATPGTGVLYTMAAGLSRGARASVIAAVGCTLGMVNVLNPKLTIFFSAFLPQFVSADEPAAVLRMVELSAVFMLLTLVVFVGYGNFAAVIRNHVIARPRVLTWIRGVFAGAFVALAARLAFTDR